MILSFFKTLKVLRRNVYNYLSYAHKWLHARDTNINWQVITVDCNRPKELKIPRGLFIPKRGLVYDHVYLQQTFGSWHTWSSMVTRCNIDQKGKVSFFLEPLTRNKMSSSWWQFGERGKWIMGREKRGGRERGKKELIWLVRMRTKRLVRYNSYRKWSEVNTGHVNCRLLRGL